MQATSPNRPEKIRLEKSLRWLAEKMLRKSMSSLSRTAISPVRNFLSSTAMSPLMIFPKALILTSRNMLSVTRPMIV